jgi:glutaryl-CoA dehydrogenase
LTQFTSTYENIGRSLGTDYFALDDELTDDERAYWQRTRDFVDQEVLPTINGYWERAEFPWELIEKMKPLGIIGDGIEYQGVPAMSPIAAGLIQQEINRGDGSLGAFLAVTAGLAMRAIAALGSEKQKDHWLPAMARLDSLGAFALTEPNHGSDSVSLETTAHRDADHWVINGAKRWIGLASVADVIVVWARDVSDGNVKGILVEQGTPGFTAVPIEGKGAARAIWQTDIAMVDVRVPIDNHLPGATSFRAASGVLRDARQGVAWSALGHATAAYEAALSYATQREQFGKPLAAFQLVQDKLVRMLADLTAMQLYCLRLGRLIERGKLTGTIAALAKLNNTRRAREVLATARELMGGNGLLLENHVMRHMCDFEAVYTYDGTADIQTLLVGRDITGVGAFV